MTTPDRAREALGVAIDFDGVIHSYTQGWTGGVPHDPPVPGALAFVRDLLARGYAVTIHTTRARDIYGREATAEWLKKHGFPAMLVTNEKPKAILYIDDRALRFQGSFDEARALLLRDDAKAACESWNKRDGAFLTPPGAAAATTKDVHAADIRQLKDYFGLGETLFNTSNRWPFARDCVEAMYARLAPPSSPPSQGAAREESGTRVGARPGPDLMTVCHGDSVTFHGRKVTFHVERLDAPGPASSPPAPAAAATEGGLPVRAQRGLRSFSVEREADESGVSGTGVVLEGVVFSTGATVVHWLTPPPKGSINIFDSFELFMAIHVGPHPTNRTTIRFSDGGVIRPGEWSANPSPFPASGAKVATVATGTPS